MNATVQVNRGSAPYDSFGETTLQLTSVWQAFRVVAHVPAGGSPVLVVQLDGPGRLDVDDAAGTVLPVEVTGVPGSAPISRLDFGQHTSDAVTTALRNGGMEGAYVPATTAKPATTTGVVAPEWAENSGPADIRVHYAGDAVVRHGGQTSQRVELTRVSAGGMQLTQRLLLVSPVAYRLAVWARGDSGQSVAVDLRGQLPPYLSYGRASAVMNGSWQRIELTTSQPQGVNSIYLAITTAQTGRLWLDDVSVVRADGNGLATRWPGTGYGSVRTWDTVSWAALEPARGAYNWAVLDSVVQMAEPAGRRVVLTLGQTPRWASPRPDEASNYGLGAAFPPRSTTDWTDFIEAVVARDGPAISCFEVWNEPNDPAFGRGSVAQLMALTRATRLTVDRVARGAAVITPAAYSVGWLDSFLAAGGGQWADVIGFHVYDPSPEHAAATLANLRTVLADHGATQPLWITEGGTGSAVTPADEQAALLARLFLVHLGWGAQAFYWYTWGLGFEISGPTIRPGDLQPNAAGRAYGQIQTWLTGWTIARASAVAGVWTVELTGPAGVRRQVLWAPDGPRTAPLPAWHPTAVVALDGSTSTPGAVVQVGPSPVLLSR